MDVILHIGAHRCATTTFQHYLRRNATTLAAEGIGFWGPWRTRGGLFRGIQPGSGLGLGRDMQARAQGRVRINLDRSEQAGIRQLIVSEENMMGSVRENLRMGELYCGVGERLARYAQVFGDRLSDVVVNIRALDAYWASALGFGITRGRPVPGPAALARLAGSPRSWRDVLSDVACAAPGARIWALPFETFGGRPEAQLAAITGLAPERVPMRHARDWLNATPRLPELRAWLEPGAAARLPAGAGRWQPFCAAEAAALRETYADDLMWLTAGAEGLARLMPDPDKTDRSRTGNAPIRPGQTRGRRNDDQDRQMAGTG